VVDIKTHASTHVEHALVRGCRMEMGLVADGSESPRNMVEQCVCNKGFFIFF
jgi:hypothetical protein